MDGGQKLMMRPALKPMLRKYGIAIALSALGLCAAAGALWQPADAQTSGWSAPQLIFEGRGAINAPPLVADAYGQVHAFWMFQPHHQGNTTHRQIYYTRLTPPT